MGLTPILPSLALAGLLFIFVTRARNAIAVPAARLSWLASGVGSLALFAQGFIVPLPVLDGLLGGTNLINLAQNTFSTVAFWLVMQAVITQNRRKLDELRWWPLVLIVFSFSVAFFFVDRGVTAWDFILAKSDQIPLWLYASIYMAGVAGMCVNLVVGIRGCPGRAYWFFIVGGTMVALGSVIEIVFLTMQCFSLGTAELRDIAYNLFDPFFYPGVVLIAIGIGVFSTRRGMRERRLRRQVAALDALAASRDLEVPVAPALPASGRTASEVALERLYELAIALHDHVHAGSPSLTSGEAELLADADETIANQFADTGAEGMTGLSTRGKPAPENAA